MIYNKLGRSGVKVSNICLGTMNFGSFASDEESFKILDRALELGINFIDSADVYGNERGKGYTESLLGRWLSKSGRRNDIVLATKLNNPMGDGVNDRGCSAYHIKRACEASLKRLQTDHIDLYQMHHIDRSTPWEEIWQAMEQLIREGKITYVGSSNFAAWNIVEANYKAKEAGMLGLVSEQSIYSLRNRAIELEVVPACRAMGVGIIPWSPLAGGLLCGVLGGNKEGRRSREGIANAIEKFRPQLEKYEYCVKNSTTHSPADIALAWVLHNPVVTAAIVGPRTVKQLEQNAAVSGLKLSEEILTILNDIWPGPGNQAPEAYAW